MRTVKINGTPPSDWIADAEGVTKLLHKARTAKARAKLIDQHKSLWIDDRIRNWLLQQFHNKCWYSEAKESVSAIHVDHFRPKTAVRNDTKADHEEGYWWLTFDWKNYRIVGQLINVKKSDLFPLLTGPRAKAKGKDELISIKLESPLLIDPCTHDAAMVSFRREESACLAVPAAGIAELDVNRVTKSIDVLGLNRLSRLNIKRAEYWDKCLALIREYEGISNTDAPGLNTLLRPRVIESLKEMIREDAEFSSVCDACIDQEATDRALVKAVRY